MAGTSPSLPVTGDPAADRLLVENPFALLLGMLLDQQITMEMAFAGPHRLRERLDGRLDPETIAHWDPDDFDARFRTKPALHRFPGSMSKRVRALSAVLVDRYDGQTEKIWTEAADGADLLARLRELPGFGEEKARIFVAVLAKRFGIKPRGWKAAAGPFADATPRSVADIGSPEGLAKVRAWKKQQKAKGLSKSD
jgi:uncharacterized HhH-GPD family protein